MQNSGYTIGTETSGSAQIELSSTSVSLEVGGDTEEVIATIKADKKYMLVDGIYYPLTITESTASLGEEGKSKLAETTEETISLSNLSVNATNSITANLNTSTGVITITSKSAISENEKVELIYNNTNYGTINVAVISTIGDYVNYNVPYTDMYSDTDPNTEGLQGYNFTATDGWRIISRTRNLSDSSKYDLKIISTGVPAILNYHYSTNAGNQNNGWWGTDEQVTNLYGRSYAHVGDWPAYYASTGLNKNFENIIFDNGGAQSTKNKGCWKSVAGKTSGTGADFVASGFASGTISVHDLTLAEINNARKINDTSNTRSTQQTDGDMGLFYLRNLANENSNFSYKINTYSYYWIAHAISDNHLSFVDPDGEIRREYYGSNGLRPVVEIKGVTMTQDPTSKVWTISQ